MADPFNQTFFPASFQELFGIWNRFPDAKIFAGGIEHLRNQNGRVPVLPEHIISLQRLEEMGRISRTEKYLEIGAMVKLNQILQLGRIVPEVLIKCLESIAGPQVRNMASIGGNLCNFSRKLDCSAPMIALDAQYELRTAKSSRWISASRFSSLPGPPELARNEILARIRIPLNPWTFTRYFKFRNTGNNEPGGNILFIMQNQKNILTHIRVVYCGQMVLRERNSEIMLEGKHLPLDRKNIAAFIDKWKTYLSVFEGNENSIFAGTDENSYPELEKAQILNFIENTLMSVSA